MTVPESALREAWDALSPKARERLLRKALVAAAKQAAAPVVEAALSELAPIMAREAVATVLRVGWGTYTWTFDTVETCAARHVARAVKHALGENPVRVDVRVSIDPPQATAAAARPGGAK